MANPRIYLTTYYSARGWAAKNRSHAGRATTLHGALRAAIVHMLRGRALSVLVENLDTAQPAARLWMHNGRINIIPIEQGYTE